MARFSRINKRTPGFWAVKGGGVYYFIPGMIFGFLGKFWIDLSGRKFVEKNFRDTFFDFNIFVSGFSPGFGKGLVKSLPNGFGKDLIKPLPNPAENLETIF